MGFEYRILVSLPSTEAGERILQNILGGCGQRSSQGWEYRAPATNCQMPTVMAKVEPYGFYLCFFGGKNGFGAEVAGEIVLSALSFSEVKVQEIG